MKDKHENLNSQLALPFLESFKEHLDDIFLTLEQKFGLVRNSDKKFIDLGSGDGRVVIYSGLNYNIKSLGIEINENLIQEALDEIKKLKKAKKFSKNTLKKIKIQYGDLFRLDLNDFDFIYTFSLPSIHKFMNHVFITAKKEAILIAYKYPLKGFDTYLKLEYTLEHKIEKEEQQISTFFYRRI